MDEQGILHYFHFDAASKASTELLSFQLQLCSPEPDAAPEPIQQPWSFEFVPGLPGEIMLVQANSCRILYASLPRQGTNASDVFLFGSHSGMQKQQQQRCSLLRVPVIVAHAAVAEMLASCAWRGISSGKTGSSAATAAAVTQGQTAV